MTDSGEITEIRFTENIAKLRRRAHLKYASQFILYGLGAFLILHGVLFAVEKSGVLIIEWTLPLYALCSAIALFAAAGLMFFTKLPFAHLLIDIDERCALEDRLSTAYEYRQREKRSIFTEGLLEDAAHHLEGVEMKELLPFGFSRLYVFLIFAGVANLLLLFVQAAPQDEGLLSGSQIRERELEKPAGQKFEKQEQRQKDFQNTQEERDAYRRIQEKTKELQRTDLSAQERREKLQDMLQEVQAMQDRLSEAAAAQNGSSTLDDLPIRQLPQQRSRKMSRLQSLEDLLQAMLSKNTSGRADRLQELPPELQEQFSKLLEELEAQKSDSPEAGQGRGAGADAENSESASGENSAGEGDREKFSQNESVAGGNEERNRAGRDHESRMSEADPESELNRKGTQDEEQGQSTAGTGTADGREYPPSFPETSDAPVLQDKVRSAEREQYNIHIRSVTEIGKAAMPEQEVTRPYRQEVESVLQQEEMPLNYREYIKNYFLSIGLTEESPDRDSR